MILSVVDLIKYEQQQPRQMIQETNVARISQSLVASVYLNRLA